MVKYAPDDKGEDKPWLPAVKPETGEEKELMMMSKYVLCSPDYAGELVAALATNPEGKGSGREAYLMSRAGTIVDTHRIRFSNVDVFQRGKSQPFTLEDTEHHIVVITAQGRDDIIKWKLGLFTGSEHMSMQQRTLHEHIDHDNDDNPTGAVPDWANGAIVLVECDSSDEARRILENNNVTP